MGRALQLDILLSGLRDPDTNAPLAGGVVYFYAAGTTTAKNVWSEKAKTNAFTFVTLDSNGSVASPYYGDGWYKIVVKDANDAVEYTWDQVYLQSNSFSVVQKSGTYTATPDDDIIICVSGTWTLSLQTVADFEHPLDIVNVGTGTITVDPSSTQTIGGSSTLTLASGQRIRIVPDTTSTTWRRVDFSTDLNGSEFVLDADGDTSITADTDDQIDFKTGGSDRVSISNTGMAITGDIVQNTVTQSIEKFVISSGYTHTFDMVLVAGGLYRLTYSLHMPTYSPGAYLIFNSDTGNNYTYFSHSAWDAGAGVTSGVNSGEATNKILIANGNNTITDGIATGEAIIAVRSSNNAMVSFRSVEYSVDADYATTYGGGYYAGAAAITSVTVFQSGESGNWAGTMVLERIA